MFNIKDNVKYAIKKLISQQFSIASSGKILNQFYSFYKDKFSINDLFSLIESNIKNYNQYKIQYYSSKYIPVPCMVSLIQPLIRYIIDSPNSKRIFIQDYYELISYFGIEYFIIYRYSSEKNQSAQPVQSILVDKKSIINVLSQFRELFYNNYDQIYIKHSDKSDCTKVLFSKIENNSDLIPFKTNSFYKIQKYISDFNNQSINRSILLYGNPGTGKSTLALSVIKNLNYKTIRFSNIANTYDVVELCKILQPEAIIIDDFDKINLANALQDKSILDTLEYFSKNIKLTIFTINDLEVLKKYPALIRPGRIDKFFEINLLEKEVVMKFLGNENEDLYEKVKDFPIAFFEEIRKIIKVYGKEYFLENFEEFNNRVKDNIIR